MAPRAPRSRASRWGEPVALGFTILAITYVSLVVGELTPKSLALRNPERLACHVARPIQRLVRIAAWPSRALTGSTHALLALLGQGDAPTAPLVSEEEVKFLIRQGAAHGVFERAETELVHRVFQFTDTTVRAIMVPRPRILALDIEMPPDQVLARVVEYGRTRIPVFRESVDSIVGMVVIKDLLRCAAQGSPIVLDRMLHPVLLVPETTRVSEVLREFQRERRNLAIVVDEYGHVTGLVTTEDLLEEIVGEIRDEREAPELEGVSRLPDGSYLVDGLVTVRDLRERVGIPMEESPEYQTVAGFMLQRLQTLPRPGMSVSAFGYEWTVVDLEGPRIAKVKARRLESRPA
jgi:putative hemolysin